jgi:hypothetical protein
MFILIIYYTIKNNNNIVSIMKINKNIIQDKNNITNYFLIQYIYI